jgi:hypothetical protein
MKKKLAQTTGAAALVGVVALVLLVYIILIPASDRDSLLGITTPTEVTPSEPEMDIIEDFTFSGPGRVESVEGNREILLPSVNLRTRINSKIFLEDNAFYVANSFFGNEVKKVLGFSIEDLSKVDNLRMSFLTKKSLGILKITINGFDLYQNNIETVNIEPIKIDKSLLRNNNVLEISVNSPGILFWKRNEYIIDDFKVYGDFVETSQQTSMTSFDIKSSEFRFLKRTRLRFYPACDQTTVGSLYIKMNGGEVYNQIPDCNMLNIYDIPITTLYSGINALEFGTYADTYLIDRVSVEIDVSESDDLVYYFDLDKSLFNVKTTARHICGEIDDVCPSGCGANYDRDCCFLEYTNAYWCAVPTDNINDRCVGRVDESNVNRCPSGYEDKNGRIHPDFKGICGDNHDSVCPEGCSMYYDKDCCLELGYFWCKDLPTTGVAGICVPTVTQDSCAFCPSGYVGKDFNPKCDKIESRTDFADEVELKPSYDVEFIMRFINDGSRKRGVIRVNNYEMSFDTYDSEFVQKIDRFVLDGNNYVQILPGNTFELVNVKIDVKKN